ncbi:MAG: CotH kinase family protein, partial [Bacteroidota bacterium]
VRAKIFYPNYFPSPTFSRTYLVGIEHELPIVTLTTEPDNFFSVTDGIYALGNNASEDFPYFGANFWEDWERPLHFALYPQADSLGIAQNIGTKIFGGWSRGNDQKSLSLFARSSYGPGEFAYPFFSQRPFEEYQALVLRNSGNDWLHSMFRDAMHTSLMEGLDLEFQAYRPTVAYLNGTYWGIHNLREKVNEHFIASRFDVNPDEVNLLEFNGEIIQGDNSDYLDLIAYVQTNDLANPNAYQVVADQIDVDNFALYLSAQVYWNNTDWPGNNIKFWNAPGRKWRWIYFDTDFGSNVWSPFSHFENTLAFALEPNGPGWPNPPWSTLLTRRLVEQPIFRNKFVNQLADLMNSRYLPATVNGHIDTLTERLASEIPVHFERWEGDTGTWDEQVGRMRNFVNQRPSLMKNNILEEFNLPAYRSLELTIDHPSAGYVQLNTLTITADNWQGDYFQNVPI